MDQTVDFMRQWASDLHNWAGVAGAVLLVMLGWYILHLQGYRHVERAMAKRKERQEVADLVSAALQDACHSGAITAEVWHKYNKKLAKALGLPDMLPKKPFNLSVAKHMAHLRLTGMGVNIQDGLNRIRGRRTSKKNRLLAALPKKQ